ncbi:hypothetical protein GcM1_230023 [Golovinomyces cichoracearum]|uniref:Uncharacterized protein n=1 Tax=Golovinomyces cichoracearum TaxID=62708 RepID=A0A420IN61_9PEZI|nr:hypothetical protein GcM1_230023 [Golovinomyces cichoracearum]
MQFQQDNTLSHQQNNTTCIENWARMISDMKKIYDYSKIFSGNEYDPLELKLNIFEERCKVMGIENNQKYNVFELRISRSRFLET